jgi:hypothetical protein
LIAKLNSAKKRVVIWALKQDELYASPSLEMLKAIVEKIKLRCNRKNLSPIEKIKVLQKALYWVSETDLFNVTQPLRYQSTETRPNRSYLNSCKIKDAVQKFINAKSEVLKGGFIPCKNF